MKLDQHNNRAGDGNVPNPLPQPGMLALPRCELAGRFCHNGDLVIAGRFNGGLHVTGDVLLTESAHVTGSLFATNIRIRGRFQGELCAAGGLMLQGDAVCTGVVNAAWLAAGDGTMLEADLTLGVHAEAA